LIRVSHLIRRYHQTPHIEGNDAQFDQLWFHPGTLLEQIDLAVIGASAAHEAGSVMGCGHDLVVVLVLITSRGRHLHIPVDRDDRRPHTGPPRLALDPADSSRKIHGLPRLSGGWCAVAP
jgi:hypothetical protein